MMLWIVAIGLFTVVLVSLAALAWWVDDWRRDLTTNVAETAPDAADQNLRPLEVTATFAQIDAAAQAIALSSGNWQYLADESSPPVGTTVGTIRMVHRTKVFGFSDDVTLTVSELAAGKTTIHLHSASRVGVGDLGQNPRNIRELRGRLAESLAFGTHR